MCPASRCLSLPFLPNGRGQAPSSSPGPLNPLPAAAPRPPALSGTYWLSLLLFAACALLSHPSHPPACRALASPPVTGAGLRARAAAGPVRRLRSWHLRPSCSLPAPCNRAFPLLAFLARRTQRVQHPPLNLPCSVPKRACFSPFIDRALIRLQTGHSTHSSSSGERAPSAKQTPRVSPHKQPAQRS